MAIYRKSGDGTWYYSVYVPGRSKRLRGSCGTSNEAEARLVEQTLRVAAGRKSPKEHVLRLIDALYADEKPVDAVPLEAAFFEVERVMRLNGKDVSAQTLNHKRRSLGRLAEWAAENWPSAASVQDVDRPCAQAFTAWLQKSGIKQKSVFNVTSELGSCWNILKRAHDGLENPWPLASPMEHKSDRREVFTPEEVERIFAAADKLGHQWPLACRLGACTGLRYGDIARLKFEDVEDGAIRVTPSKTRKWGVAVCIPLPPDILAMIGEGDGFIMPEHAHCYGTMKRIKRCQFSDVLREAGLDPAQYDFHTFRHYFRTRLAAAGVSDDVAMRLGGWTQRDTAARYDHDEHREELAAAIQAAWTAE